MSIIDRIKGNGRKVNKSEFADDINNGICKIQNMLESIEDIEKNRPRWLKGEYAVQVYGGAIARCFSRYYSDPSAREEQLSNIRNLLIKVRQKKCDSLEKSIDDIVKKCISRTVAFHDAMSIFEHSKTSDVFDRYIKSIWIQVQNIAASKFDIIDDTVKKCEENLFEPRYIEVDLNIMINNIDLLLKYRQCNLGIDFEKLEKMKERITNILLARVEYFSQFDNPVIQEALRTGEKIKKDANVTARGIIDSALKNAARIKEDACNEAEGNIKIARLGCETIAEKARSLANDLMNQSAGKESV